MRFVFEQNCQTGVERRPNWCRRQGRKCYTHKRRGFLIALIVFFFILFMKYQPDNVHPMIVRNLS